MIAVTDDELRHRSLVALRRTVPPQPTLLEVRRIDDQRISGEPASGKSREAMRSPGRRMRTAIHPDDPMSLRGLGPHIYGDQLLVVWIALLPHSEIPHRAHLIRHDVGVALVMAERQARGIVRQCE